jgi:hypothetical protein
MWREMRREMRTDNRRRKLRERDCLKELAGDGRLIVKSILKIECDDMDQIIWHITGPMNVCYVYCNRLSGCSEFLDLASNYWLKRDSALLGDNVEITYDCMPAHQTDHSCPDY